MSVLQEIARHIDEMRQVRSPVQQIVLRTADYRRLVSELSAMGIGAPLYPLDKMILYGMPLSIEQETAIP